jgi:prepilin-type N-terminal cleavage/methylation domain-containing protein
MKINRQSGFTVVELLIVIVIIGILAAITIVAYNGIQERARASSVSSALSQAVKKIAVWQVDNPSTSPSTLATAGITDSNEVSYQYTAGTGGTYCITATTGPTSYKITESSQPSAGGCSGHGQGGVAAITNLETNPGSETTPFGNAGGGTGTRTLSASQKMHGTYSTQYVWGSGASGVGNSTVTVSPSTTYRVSLYVYSLSGAVPGFAVAASDYATNVQSLGAATAGQWRRLSISYTTTASQTTLRYWTTVSAASTFYVDSVLIAQGTSDYGYADGSFANWVWNGAANSSSSTGPPQ